MTNSTLCTTDRTSPRVTSVSRIGTYRQCSQYYNLRYNENIRYDETSDYSLIGTLTHKALERMYKGDWATGNLVDHFKEVSNEVLTGLSILLPHEVGGPIYRKLLAYAEGVNSLYLRASEGYSGEDAIRTRDGRVSTKPQSTGQWKTALRDLRIEDYKQELDAIFLRRSPGLSFSLTDVFAEAFSICHYYKHPKGLEEVIAVEYGISVPKGDELVNPLQLGDTGLYLNAYIDFVCKINKKLCIIDFKSYTSIPDINEVSHNPQILTYAMAWEQIHGQKVDTIGIYHLRSSQLISSPLPLFYKEVIDEYFKVTSHIDNEIYHRHIPGKYSPCMKWFNRVCPYLGQCWPSISSST